MLAGVDNPANPSSDEIDGLMVAIDRVRLRRQPVRPEALRDDLRRLRQACNFIELEFAAVAAAFAATGEDEWEGCVSPIQWLREECHMSGGAASNAVCVGEQAEAVVRSTEAVRDGRIGFAHLALLAETAEALRESPTSTSFDEQPLLHQALSHNLGEFRRDCAHVRHAHDAEAFLADQVGGVDARRLQVKSCEGGVVFLKGWFDPDGGALVRTALDPLARPDGAGDYRSRERRYADALVELAGHSLDAALVPMVASQRPHLQVTTTLATLLGVEGAPAGELEFAGPIAAATVQRYACDASVTRVLIGPGSAVIDVGRAKRVPSGPARRALRARYCGCAWPGCDRPSSWTAAHHLVHWAHGGATDLDNLVLICHRHHWMVHEGGWKLLRAEDGRMLAVAPVPSVEWRARGPDDGPG